jgi:hypothetical protein
MNTMLTSYLQSDDVQNLANLYSYCIDDKGVSPNDRFSYSFIYHKVNMDYLTRYIIRRFDPLTQSMITPQSFSKINVDLTASQTANRES